MCSVMSVVSFNNEGKLQKSPKDDDGDYHSAVQRVVNDAYDLADIFDASRMD